MAAPGLKDALDKLQKELDTAIADGEDPKEAADRIFPRLFWFGHKLLHTFEHPDKRGKWECIKCKHQWVHYSGIQCPSCKDCKHEWYDKEDGKRCGECNIKYEDTQ